MKLTHNYDESCSPKTKWGNHKQICEVSVLAVSLLLNKIPPMFFKIFLCVSTPLNWHFVMSAWASSGGAGVFHGCASM
jgi:hypothetical protein